MRHESPLLLWAAFPMLAMWRESALWPERRFSLAWLADTAIRLAVWVLFAWSVIRSEWPAVFGTAVAIGGLGLTAVAFRALANRKGWRQRWLQS